MMATIVNEKVSGPWDCAEKQPHSQAPRIVGPEAPARMPRGQRPRSWSHAEDSVVAVWLGEEAPPGAGPLSSF